MEVRERLNSFGGRCLARMCFPVIWQLALAQLTSQSACCYREHVRRFGGPTAPSPASRVKELRSATGIASADGGEHGRALLGYSHSSFMLSLLASV